MRASEAGRLIVSGVRGPSWKTRAITPNAIAVSREGTVIMTATLTPATEALLRTRTTTYKTITLRRAAPLPVVG